MADSTADTKAQKVHRETSWLDVSWLMLSDIIGTSVLVFPGIARNLGWVLTVVFIMGLFPISLFVSLLMARTRGLLAELALAESPTSPPPKLGTMGEVARSALGHRWAVAVYFAVYGYNLLGQASYLLVLGTSIQQVFWSTPVCITWAIAGGCAILVVPIFTIRRLGESVQLCLVNTLIIVAVIAVALTHIAFQGRASCAETHLVPPGLTVMTVLGQVTNVLYAFTGQWMYFELMDTMAQPKDFPRAFAVTGPFMVGVYLIVALVAYALGAGHDDLVASVQASGTLRAVAVLLFVHVAIVYLIKSVVLARYFHGLLRPGDVDLRTADSYVTHGGFGVAMLAFGFVVANAVPFFSQLLGLIGGLLAGPINFLIPIALYLAALGRHVRWHKRARAERVESGNENLEATTYGTCKIEECEPAEGDSFTTESVCTSAQEEEESSRGGNLLAAVCAMPAWELAMLLLTLLLTLLTIGLGFSEQVREVLAKQAQFGRPFSCHALALGTSGYAGCTP
eukprot:CAMPEP_0171185294 /NCGR_PEP_ID=MMETSP0790-20130122/16228_1 /TAXON_ID=2925 /ORGANISM="Alexandrium catenella, Strain OF101" /LENGTH=509 /DNA_ID=CAMNT_0011650313 /DNA_START=39 /DNA_END=1568 /DNA_ORIENTATION=+